MQIPVAPSFELRLEQRGFAVERQPAPGGGKLQLTHVRQLLDGELVPEVGVGVDDVHDTRRRGPVERLVTEGEVYFRVMFEEALWVE
jgi:hypothetical protein